MPTNRQKIDRSTRGSLTIEAVSNFERMLAIELEGLHDVSEEEGGGAREYGEVAAKVYATLQVRVHEVGIAHIDRSRPPAWVARISALAKRWERARRKFEHQRAAAHSALLQCLGLEEPPGELMS